MIRLGVISDSHQAQLWAEAFLRQARKRRYDAVVFLGDGESEARFLSRRLEMPLHFVAGNCDWSSKAPRELLLRYEGHTLLATHGHLHDVKWEMDHLSYYAEDQGADIALYGHTHIPKCEYVGPTLTLNPGALMNGCYAELELDRERVLPRLLNLEDVVG